MQILLSCSKDMRSQHEHAAPRLTEPHFRAEAERIARAMNQLSVEALGQQLGINAQLAALNLLRYQRFFDEGNTHAAALAYSGMAYRHLDAPSWTAADFEEAQSHLFHTSFLYGLLRPLDAIKDYRLEGRVQLPELGDQSLFRHWRSLLTDYLIQATQADDGVLLFLASAEMKQLFDWKRVERSLRVVTPEFLVARLSKEGSERLSNVVVYTKMMRGATTRHLITQRLRQPEALAQFSYEGFCFAPELSDAHRLTWVLR